MKIETVFHDWTGGLTQNATRQTFRNKACPFETDML